MRDRRGSARRRSRVWRDRCDAGTRCAAVREAERGVRRDTEDGNRARHPANRRRRPNRRVGRARVDGRHVHRVFAPGPTRRFIFHPRGYTRRHPRGSYQAAQAGPVHDRGEDGGDGDGRLFGSKRILGRRRRRRVRVHGAVTSNVA